MKGVWIALAALLVLFVASDQLIKASVEGQLESDIAATAQVASVDVQIQGFPLLVNVVRGVIPVVAVRLDGLVVGDPELELRQVDAELVDVAVDLAAAVGRPLDGVEAGDGVVTVRIGESEVAAIVARERPGWTAAFQGEKLLATGDVEGTTVQVVAEVVLEGQVLVAVPVQVNAGSLGVEAQDLVQRAFDFRYELPEVIEGFLFTRAEIVGGTLVLRGPAPSRVALPS